LLYYEFIHVLLILNVSALGSSVDNFEVYFASTILLL